VRPGGVNSDADVSDPRVVLIPQRASVS